MKTQSFFACSFLVAMIVGSAGYPDANLNDKAEQAVSANPAVAQAAQTSLREAGPSGLQALEQRFAKEIQLHRGGAPSDARWNRIALALNHVGGQYDNYASGLYWYTDLEKAKGAARASGKPILSLRLLGRLDEDLSCANSRFFRTTLYPSAEINQLLKQRFILHWQSVRPAPKVTIEFGDGRKLQRTITGNSLHYVLDPEGRVVDALPGLYSAGVFVEELSQAADVAEAARKTGNSDYTQHFKATREGLLRAWASDLRRLQVALPPNQPLSEGDLEQRMGSGDALWQLVAQLHMSQVGFDSGVREVMERKLSKAGAQQFPNALSAARAATSKSMVEVPMLRTFSLFSDSVVLDTAKNDYMLRTKILDYLMSTNAQSMKLDQINDWIYARIFLTPGQDPWLGLSPQGIFTAIDGNGELR
jgi:hypothetical protein